MFVFLNDRETACVIANYEVKYPARNGLIIEGTIINVLQKGSEYPLYTFVDEYEENGKAYAYVWAKPMTVKEIAKLKIKGLIE